MNEQMEFPETFEQFVKEYGFKDNKEVYTNGSDLIPIFRVKQWLEHQMTADEYRQRMIQAFCNADCDELIAICILPTEKEFEHLEWLLKNHYKKEPCEDAISRKAAIAETYRDCTYVKSDKDAYEQLQCIRDGINKLPSVQPKPTECEDAVSREAAIGALKQLQKNISRDYTVLDPMVMAGTAYIGDCIGELQDLPPVNPQPKTGHWIDADGDNAICGCCNRLNHLYGTYCKHCGAKMVEPQESEDRG